MADPAISYAVGAAVTRADIPGLCAGLTALVGGGGPGVVVCEVSGRPTLVTVEALARLRLIARRYGWELTVRGAGPELRGLLVLTGLSAEVGWEPEEREQPGGVQEIVDARDPPG